MAHRQWRLEGDQWICRERVEVEYPCFASVSSTTSPVFALTANTYTHTIFDYVERKGPKVPKRHRRREVGP